MTTTETYKPVTQIKIGDKIVLKTGEIVTVTGKQEGVAFAPMRSYNTIILSWEAGQGEILATSQVAMATLTPTPTTRREYE